MKNKKSVFALFVFLLASVNSYANGTVSDYVKSVQVRETGNLEITLEAHHGNPDGCVQAGKVVIEHSHVAKKEILSLVLTALSQHKSTSYYLVGCLEQYNTTYPKGYTAFITY